MKPATQRTDRDRLLSVLFFLALLILLVIAVCIHIFPENRFDRYVQEKHITWDLRPVAIFG